ncbi:hypothetical protein [Desulfoluna sp.]|uniref:hypothetical protein n=1 Tax=Desulfoluna sp. TaxID=2045199 RepID=UPI002635439D|nr:hypothetical protein [Desulfoluna sp.]
MKRTALALLMTFFFSAPALAVENPWTKKLPFKEGTVSYEISGTIKGNETVYVKDHGHTTAAYRTETGSSFGFSTNTRELTLTTPDWIYTVDLDDNTGTKQINPKKVITDEFNRLSRKDQKKLVKNSDQLGITLVGGLSGSVEKKAVKLLGYRCDRVTAMGIETCTLTGTDFPMKSSGQLMGMTFREEATRIEKKRVASQKFSLPQGADILHEPAADAAITGQIRMMFQSLLEGERPVSRQEQGMNNEEMGDAIKALQQMQGLFGPSNDNE